MSVWVKYTSKPNKAEQQHILSLLANAFVSPVISANTRAGFFTGFRWGYENFVLLMSDKVVIGVAIIGKRKINLLKDAVVALSIGPIAIAPEFQRRGYSFPLMEGINNLADKLGAVVLYLQGINGFYQRFGFYQCSPKSKIVFNTNEIEEVPVVSIKRLEAGDVKLLKEIYFDNASVCSCTSLRTTEDWDWLTNFASNTWYFFEPIVVLSNNEPIGYFCSDPDNYGRIREAVFDQSEEGIRSFLMGVKIFCQQKSIGQFEVMTWQHSALYDFSKKNCNANFIQFFKKNGSQVMRVHDFRKISTLINALLPARFSIRKIELVRGEAIFHFECDGGMYPFKIAEKLVPGLLCGFFDFVSLPGFLEMPLEFKAVLGDLSARLAPPFFFQGDNY